MRSTQLLQELADEQAAGAESSDPMKLAADAGKMTVRYSADNLPGHAAWMDGRYKLHRLPGKPGKPGKSGESGKVSYALFDLENDPQEKRDLINKATERAARMKADLESWQKSVIKSLNGEDYAKQ